MKNYLEKYKGYQLPKLLETFITFNLEVKEDFSTEFSLEPEDVKHMFESYSEDKQFVNKFICIGEANDFGSQYAFYLNNDKDVSKAPIVLFGDEGGVFVVAENFEDFLRLLALDAEVYVDSDSIELELPEEPSNNYKKYINWLESMNVNTDINKENILEQIQLAQDKIQPSLYQWMNPFYEMELPSSEGNINIESNLPFEEFIGLDTATKTFTDTFGALKTKIDWDLYNGVLVGEYLLKTTGVDLRLNKLKDQTIVVEQIEFLHSRMKNQPRFEDEKITSYNKELPVHLEFNQSMENVKEACSLKLVREEKGGASRFGTIPPFIIYKYGAQTELRLEFDNQGLTAVMLKRS